MKIDEFLLERLDEDFEIAWGAASSPWREGEWDGRHFGNRELLDKHEDVTAHVHHGGTYGYLLHFDPTRTIADIRAKKLAVHTYRLFLRDETLLDRITNPSAREAALLMLRSLAQPYANHPAFQQEWLLQVTAAVG